MKDTLVSTLRRHAHGRADQLAYRFLIDGEVEGAHWTYAEVDRRARMVAAHLQDAGAVGERALLLFPPGLDFIAGFLGCLYAGTTAVPAYPPASRRHWPRLRAIADDAKPKVVLTEGSVLPRLKRAADAVPGLDGLAWLAVDALDDEAANAWRPHAPVAAELAFLQYTSGSTATPKGVMVTHGNLMHNEVSIARAFGQNEDSVIVGWLPVYHDMGLIGNVLQPLYLGARCVLMSPVAFLQKPLRWLQAVDTYRATTSGGPNFAYDLCVARIAPEDRAALDLSSWRLAYSGAEPVRGQTLDAFSQAFAPVGFKRRSFYSCYGLAEATLMVTGGATDQEPAVRRLDTRALEQNAVVRAESNTGDRDHGDSNARVLIGCGHVQGDQRLVIADPATNAVCPAHRIGEIWIAGESIAAGYWRQPEMTQRDFGAHLTEPMNDGFCGPFLRTGDLGFIDPNDGEVFVTGRIKDMVIIRGRNHYPHDIERTAEASHGSVRAGCGAAVAIDNGDDEKLVVVYELVRHPTDPPEVIVDTVRRAVAEEHQVQVHDVVLIRAGTVPKTSSGKIQRHVCRAAYQDGTLTVIAQSTALVDAVDEADTEFDAELTLDAETVRSRGDKAARVALVSHWLGDRFARLARVPVASVDHEAPLTSQGLDSLIAVEMGNELAQSLGVTVEMSTLLEGASIAGVATDVVRRLATEEGGLPRGDGLPEVVARAELDHYQPSHGEAALWYLHRMAPDSVAYNMGGAAKMKRLDVGRLEVALQVLVARHPSLRTSFSMEGGTVEARVAPTVTVPVSVDVAPNVDHRDARLTAFLAAPFRLTSAPLLRVGVFRVTPTSAATPEDAAAHVALSMHHIVGDFWSLGVLLRELGRCYSDVTAAGLLPPLLVSPALAAGQERDRLAGPEGDRLLAYWRQELASPRTDLDLPTDRPRPATQTFRGGRVDHSIERVRPDDVKRLAAATGTTPYMIMLAVFQTLLCRFAGQTDISVGSPTAGRADASRSGVVGYFVNPVVLRADLAGNPTFRSLLAATRSAVLAAFSHQDVPFPLLVEALQPERDASRSPLFQAMFVWQQDRLPEERGLAGFALGIGGAAVTLGGLELESVPVAAQGAQMDVSLLMAEVAGRLHAGLTYNADLFDESTAVRMLGHLETLLAGALAEPDRRLSSLPLLAESDHQALAAWNPPVEEGVAACLHTMVADQAALTPHAEALVVGAERYTYAELIAAADRLAARLMAMGVGPESRIGVCGPRNAALMVGMLGVLRAGGAYVPLDPAYPHDRLRFTLDDADVAALLVVDAAPFDTDGLPTIDLTPFTPVALARTPSSDTPTAVSLARSTPDNLAYVIYTSGSTGRPKGVAISHRSAATLVRWAAGKFPASARQGVLAATSICFDLSIFELFVPWATGGKVILADNALALSSLPAREEVTLINTVPSAMAELVAGHRRLPDSVTTVNLAGEPLPGSLARQVFHNSQITALFDLYGPSEDTTYSTGASFGPDDPGEPTIGRAIEATQAHVVDRALERVPIGVPGELLLGGAGLARGYLGRPALTAECFVPDPTGVAPGGRVYRTGDLVRWRCGAEDDEPGSLLFLGRMDYQVKIRGFRIELGEIEVALAGLPMLEDAVVVAHASGVGEQALVAYVVPDPAMPPPPVSDLRAALEKSLPAFMVPQVFVSLDALPLTPNGKVDRKALPVPEAARVEAEYVAPSTEVEEMLAEIWREVLGVERVGVTDSFFELGGHSLLAMRVLSRVHEAFDVELPVQTVLESPTIVGMAEAIAHGLLADLDEETRAAMLAELTG